MQENAGERASIGGAPWEGELCARLLSSLHHPCRGYARCWQPLLVKIRIDQRLNVKAKTSGMRSSADLVLPPISTTEAFSALSSICLASRRPLRNGSQELRWERLNLIERWALKDGKISVSERRLLWFLGVSTSIMLLADLIVVIWVPSNRTYFSLHHVCVSRALWWCSATTPGGPTPTPPLLLTAHTHPCSLPLSCYW